MLQAMRVSGSFRVSGPILLGALICAISAQTSYGLGVNDFTCCVAMRDGACLRTQVYLPRLPRGPYPIILVRTPDEQYEVTKRQARYVCHNGYGLVVQESRNCRNTPGTQMIFLNDADDGHDTILWIARQSWCNGRIGTFGPSAVGFSQNLLAPDAPPYLCAQHVMMAFSNMYTQTAYQGGALRKELVEGWLAQRPCGEQMLELVRQHPNYDEMWAKLAPEQQASHVNVPAVFWGGWYDPFLQGAINSFTTINTQGGPNARGNCRLILGPWIHQQLETLIDPRNANCYPQAGAAVRWFDYWLKCKPTGVTCDRPVHYYVMGASCEPCALGNRWKTADQWPPPHATVPFYLRSGGGLAANSAPAGDEKLSYKYDPANPVPTAGGQNLEWAAGAMDQQCVESRPDVLIFTSDVLADPVEITGPVVAKLFVSSDAPDTDFTVKLTDVYPDGRSILVTDGILRARFRNSFSKPEPLKAGEVYELTVEAGNTAIAFNRGHRIRVAISSSNCPRFEPNPNTGAGPSDKLPPRVATNTLYLSNDRPSHVILPVAAQK